jgi:hypothetical protein
MDVITEGLETCIFAVDQSGRESSWDGKVAARGVEFINQFVGCIVLKRVLQEPAFIDNCIVPSEWLEDFREDVNVIPELGFCDGQSIGVPAIPTHRRPLTEDLGGVLRVVELSKGGDAKRHPEQNRHGS